MAADNKSLGRFILDGIPPAPRGLPQVEVIFDVDANGILNVTAKDKATGKANSIKITASSGLSKEEVEKMKKEAAAHEADDKVKREGVEAKNIAEQLVYTSEKALKDAGEKVPVELRKTIEDKISDLKRAKDAPTPDLNSIKSASEMLSAEIQKIGQYMSKADDQQSTPKNQQGEEKKDEGGDGNVKDAEYQEKSKN